MFGGIERNRTNYDYATRIQRESALAEQWQKQASDNNTSLQFKKPPFDIEKKQLSQTQSTSKASRIQSIQAIDGVNGIDNVDAIESDISLSSRIDFKNAGQFDMKQDIADFVRPKALIPEYFKKEVLNKTSKNILTHLELSGATDTLIKRAEALLKEENNVKSVTDAYRNALIFA